MKTPRFLLIALAATVAPAFALAQSVGAGPADVTAKLQAAGYTEIREIEFDDGLWEAEVRRANGRWGDVSVDPTTGEVFDALANRPLMALPEVLAKVEAAGYHSVHDLDRDGALWDADAIDAQGMAVELRISGYDGRIVTVSHDHDD